MASTPLQIGLMSRPTVPAAQLCGQWRDPTAGGRQPQDQSSPGTLCMVMARISRAILLQLLPPGCPKFPCTGPEWAVPSGRPATATFFLWYTSPFSVLSVQKEEQRERGCKNAHSAAWAGSSRGHLQVRGSSISRPPETERLLLLAQALPGTVIQQGLRN